MYPPSTVFSSSQRALSEEGTHSRGFLTPVEIFKPHYANAVAKFIVSTLRKQGYDASSFTASRPFRLCEIGGGNATCCVGILDYLKSNHPDLYENTRYISVDVSPVFLQRQKENVVSRGHGEKVTFVNKSIFDFNDESQDYGFVICLELLDNLPHDKIVSKFRIPNFSEVHVGEEVTQISIEQADTKEKKGNINPTKTKQTGGIKRSGKFVEVHSPLSDAVIIEFLALFGEFYGLKDNCFMYGSKGYDDRQSAVMWDLLCSPFVPDSISNAKSTLSKKIKDKLRRLRTALVYRFGHSSNYNAIYLPTGAFLLFKKLHSAFPRHNVICADFTDLRGAMVGVNGPLVQKTEGNETIEQSSFLNATKGEYDILFPTNFNLLQAVYHMSATEACASQICSSKDFMKQYADLSATRTKLGYNPLLEDFTNTAFFIGLKEGSCSVKTEE